MTSSSVEIPNKKVPRNILDKCASSFSFAIDVGMVWKLVFSSSECKGCSDTADSTDLPSVDLTQIR